MAEHPLFAQFVYDNSEDFRMPDNASYQGLVELEYV